MEIDDTDYFLKLDYIQPTLLVRVLAEKKYPKGFKGWMLKNEIKPIDMYCFCTLNMDLQMV